MKNLTDEQVEKIYAFLEKKYVPQIDLQYELADHIACEIEILQEKDSTLSFEKALHKVYKSFGVYGFTKVRDQKINDLEKVWRKKMKEYLLEYFKLPKIILTILLSVLFYIAFYQLREILPIENLREKHSLFFILIAVAPAATIFIDSIFFRRKDEDVVKYISLTSIRRAILNISLATQGFVFYALWYPLAQGWFPNHARVYVISSIVLACCIILRHATYVIFRKWYQNEKEQTIAKYEQLRHQVG